MFDAAIFDDAIFETEAAATVVTVRGDVASVDVTQDPTGTTVTVRLREV